MTLYFFRKPLQLAHEKLSKKAEIIEICTSVRGIIKVIFINSAST